MRSMVFLDPATLAPRIRLRQPGFTHELIGHARTTPQELRGRLAGAPIAISNEVPLTSEVLEQFPNIELVAVAATGNDCVDKAACQVVGIAVTNIRGYAIHTVPEHVRVDSRVAAQSDRRASKWNTRSSQLTSQRDFSRYISLTRLAALFFRSPSRFAFPFSHN
jgi:phosphoglycerate dehydrogenase-like enzyme